MTRTDVMASSRPQTTVGAASTRRGLPRALRTLVALPVALLLSAALVAPATTPAVTPASGTSPSKEASTPATAVSPSTSTTSTPTTKAATSKDLPFTGFDLRWTVGIGLLLMGVGFSIVTLQRRERRDAGS
jgi:hypothetical protein